MSNLFWAVLDEKQKELSQEILGTFEKDSKDEMGMMAVTIAFSNKMFPGTSVLHTRLRYAFFVAWMFIQSLHEKQVVNKGTLHKYEKRLRSELQRNRDVFPEDDFRGIIGAEADENKTLVQPAFSNYFNLLKTWHIIDHQLNMDEVYEEIIDREVIDIVSSTHFIYGSFKLSTSELQVLKRLIPDSLLKTLLNDHNLVIDDLNGRFIDFDVNNIQNAEQKELCMQAQSFSILMWGTMLFYNFFLGSEVDLESSFDEWKGKVKDLIDTPWIPEHALKLINNSISDQRTHEIRKSFINQWFQYIKNHINEIALQNPPLINKDLTLFKFLANREQSLKGNRARLVNDEKEIEARYGLYPISYRWSNIKTFFQDYHHA